MSTVCVFATRTDNNRRAEPTESDRRRRTENGEGECWKQDNRYRDLQRLAETRRRSDSDRKDNVRYYVTCMLWLCDTAVGAFMYPVFSLFQTRVVFLADVPHGTDR